MVLSTEPGRADYTPAWRLHRAAWKQQPRRLGSVAQLQAARRAGRLQVTRTDIVLSAAMVKWSSGAMPVDPQRTDYLGPGQLLEAPDTSATTVTLKLHECFPGRALHRDRHLDGAYGQGNAHRALAAAASHLRGGSNRPHQRVRQRCQGVGPRGVRHRRRLLRRVHVRRADKLAPKLANLTFEQAAAVPISALTACRPFGTRGRCSRDSRC
jgi:hypothetical protein